MANGFGTYVIAYMMMGTAVPAVAAVPAPPALVQVRGLECTGNDREIRQIVIDFTAGRWREAGREWSKIVQQDDATITLVREGGLLSGMSRLERLDRSTLVLSTELHTGLIEQKRAFQCKIVPPFNDQPQL